MTIIDKPPGAVAFSGDGFRRGAVRTLPLVAGLAPFGLVAGIVAQGKGLSFAETVLMNASVYAGAAQLLALSHWSDPAPILGATVTALVVNLRMALMGPVLTPWLAHLRGWRLWGSLFFLVDHGWALSVADMRAGGRDAGFFAGCGVSLWLAWTLTSAVGYGLGRTLQPSPDHPIFFAALAAFVCLLVPLWRGNRDLLPWLVAAVTAVIVSKLLPHSTWYVLAGALAGAVAGALRDTTGSARP